MYRLTALITMIKEITLGLTTKLNKISELQKTISDLRDSVIEELRAKIIDMGPQGFLYDEDDVLAPLNYIYVIRNDYDGCYKVDKIETDENGVVIFHDAEYDVWYRISILDDNEINDIVKYIDWKQTLG